MRPGEAGAGEEHSFEAHDSRGEEDHPYLAELPPEQADAMRRVLEIARERASRFAFEAENVGPMPQVSMQREGGARAHALAGGSGLGGASLDLGDLMLSDEARAWLAQELGLSVDASNEIIQRYVENLDAAGEVGSQEMMLMEGYQALTKVCEVDGNTFPALAEIAQSNDGTWILKITTAFENGQYTIGRAEADSREDILKKLENHEIVFEEPHQSETSDDQGDDAPNQSNLGRAGGIGAGIAAAGAAASTLWFLRPRKRQPATVPVTPTDVEKPEEYEQAAVLAEEEEPESRVPQPTLRDFRLADGFKYKLWWDDNNQGYRCTVMNAENKIVTFDNDIMYSIAYRLGPFWQVVQFGNSAVISKSAHSGGGWVTNTLERADQQGTLRSDRFKPSNKTYIKYVLVLAMGDGSRIEVPVMATDEEVNGVGDNVVSLDAARRSKVDSSAAAQVPGHSHPEEDQTAA